MVSNTEIIWMEPLLARMSAQKAELVALTKALELRKGKDTDSQYALATTHVHGLFIGRGAF